MKLYERKLKFIKEKCSKENISKELNKKKEELEILNLETEIYGNNDKSEEKKNVLKKEIEKCEKLLKSIIVTVQKSDQEFDGLFLSQKEFMLENSLGDKITIPANNLVIVEVKNYNNYNDISMNLGKKKKILKSIGFHVDKIFFVGILRSLDEEKKEKGQIKKLDSKNMIIIYANESTFLGVPLFEEKIEEKKEKEQSFEDKMDQRFQDIIQMIVITANQAIK